MFAVHRDGTKILLHDPSGELAVPLILDLETGSVAIMLPPIPELAEDYVAFSSLADLKKAARTQDRSIDRAVRFSRHYSHLLSHHGGRQPTLRQLRGTIQQHYAANRAIVDRAIGNLGDRDDLQLAMDRTAITA